MIDVSSKHKGSVYKVHTRLFRKKGKGPKRFDKCCFEEFYIKISHSNIIKVRSNQMLRIAWKHAERNRHRNNYLLLFPEVL